MVLTEQPSFLAIRSLVHPSSISLATFWRWVSRLKSGAMGCGLFLFHVCAIVDSLTLLGHCLTPPDVSTSWTLKCLVLPSTDVIWNRLYRVPDLGKVSSPPGTA